jgi:CRP-like cAMP-binding protein
VKTAAEVLAGTELLDGVDPAFLADVGKLMTRAEYLAGEKVFDQGEESSSLLVIESGRLSSSIAIPNGKHSKLADLVAGDVIGELALLGDGIRASTAIAEEDTAVWILERPAFEALRYDLRPSTVELVRRIGLQAVGHLARVVAAMRTLVPGDPPGSTIEPDEFELRDPESVDYLASTLFFSEFKPEEIRELTAGLRQAFVRRGTILVPAGRKPHAMAIVLRGAIETSVRGATSARRIRIAGPGRVLGHVMLLGDNVDISGVESRAREDSVLLEVPWPRAEELLESGGLLARKFADAVWTDTVHAVQHAEHPLAIAIASAELTPS